MDKLNIGPRGRQIVRGDAVWGKRWLVVVVCQRNENSVRGERGVDIIIGMKAKMCDWPKA